MIKKTIKTLNENPKILLLYAIPFLYILIRTFLVRSSVLSDVTFAEFIQSGGAYSEPSMYISWIIGVLYYIGWGIFLYPPVLYLIYLVVDNKKQEGWYKCGLKGYWWRNFVLALIFMAAMMAIVVPLSIIAGIVIAISRSMQLLYIIIAVEAIIILAILVFMYIGISAVFAEKSFGKGLGNMFKVGVKYFFKVLPITLIAMIPTGLVAGDMVGNSVREISDIQTIILSLWGVVTGVFISTYCMHCYVEEKNKQQALLGSNQEVNSNEAPTETKY